ncbi:carbohydrate ABC transporter permease ['Fragaria x ananassa' phyllody phytoplasma]|uniref:Carbohydrate ABC transporter permease n=2 Tax='Fragaria x ananassa' phyllody phytoplasma TaxID=2358428 RepID=A0ABS5K4Q2_9MOLU|nr:carbohydrate ABC transporter permease ['Fragaria x ananassa' phyllody phytoplasma]
MNKLKIDFCHFKKQFSKYVFVFLKYLFLLLIALFLLLPFYWMFNVALQSNYSDISWYPKEFTLQNFVNFFSSKFHFFSRFVSTILVVGISTILGVVISAIIAFALSLLEFKTKKIIFGVFLVTTMITTESMFLINYKTVAYLGLVNPGQGSLIPGGVYLALVLPFLINFVHIFLLMQNIQKIPKELYLSAKVDGSNDFKFLRKILIPLLKGNLINIIIFRAVSAWNAYLWPQLVGAKLLTNEIRIFYDSEQKQNLINEQMAALVVITIPLILLFLFCKKYILEGKLNSGIKG